MRSTNTHCDTPPSPLFFQKFKSLYRVVTPKFLQLELMRFEKTKNNFLALHVLKCKESLFYLDIGASHPFKKSNSYVWEKKGCLGVLVEPNRFLCNALKKYRKGLVINKLVGNNLFKRAYFESSDYHLSSLDEQRVKRMNRFYKKRFVEGVTLKVLLKLFPMVDVVSIDVEGAEMEVLKSHDWKIKPLFFLVEFIHSPGVEDFLLKKGYNVIAKDKENLLFKRLG